MVTQQHHTPRVKLASVTQGCWQQIFKEVPIPWIAYIVVPQVSCLCHGTVSGGEPAKVAQKGLYFDIRSCCFKGKSSRVLHSNIVGVYRVLHELVDCIVAVKSPSLTAVPSQCANTSRGGNDANDKKMRRKKTRKTHPSVPARHHLWSYQIGRPQYQP